MNAREGINNIKSDLFQVFKQQGLDQDLKAIIT